MYVVTGVTGQVGGVTARTLLAAGLPVRAVVRNADKGQAWAAQGCEVALADMTDAAALQRAFTGVEAVFLLIPPTFDPTPGFPEVWAVIHALTEALLAARPERVVCLSTIGAQAGPENLLTQLQIVERELRRLPLPITFLRAGWFMENAAWDVASARDTGLIHSFLQPLDQRYPMVATADVGRTAAGLMQQSWVGQRVVELEGPQRVSPQDIAATFGRVLGRSVDIAAVPRADWSGIFSGQGMKNPWPRARMIDGFNEGWICFEGEPASIQRGEITLETVLRKLVEAAR